MRTLYRRTITFFMIRELYKILFEVLFLHEYYLTDPDQRSVFDAANINDAGAFLDKRWQQGQPSTLDGVLVRMAAASHPVFARQQLRLVPGYSRLQVVARVDAKRRADGSVTYKPVVPLNNAVSLVLLLEDQGATLSEISNGRMQRNIDGTYFFSNAAVSGNKTYPSLSNPIAAKLAAYDYEQGELVKDGNAVKAYYFDGQESQFAAIAGDGFVNESDRILTGTSFVYRFMPTDAVTNASFALLDASGKVLRTITAKASVPLREVALNFSQDVAITTADGGDVIVYTLRVTGTGNYARSLPLVFYGNADELGSAWGVVNIRVGAADDVFGLVDAEGNLRTRVRPDGTVVSPPSFQLRVKSLFRFRKYVNQTGLGLTAPAGGPGAFLQQSGNGLTTRMPVPLTYLPYFFSTNPSAASPSWVYLPAPLRGGVTEFTNKQFFSVVRVPESKLFPTNP